MCLVLVGTKYHKEYFINFFPLLLCFSLSAFKLFYRLFITIIIWEELNVFYFTDECMKLLMSKSDPQSTACTEVVGAHIRTIVISMDRLTQYLV